jgi:hypothetical protein
VQAGRTCLILAPNRRGALEFPPPSPPAATAASSVNPQRRVFANEKLFVAVANATDARMDGRGRQLNRQEAEQRRRNKMNRGKGKSEEEEEEVVEKEMAWTVT